MAKHGPTIQMLCKKTQQRAASYGRGLSFRFVARQETREGEQFFLFAYEVKGRKQYVHVLEDQFFRKAA